MCSGSHVASTFAISSWYICQQRGFHLHSSTFFPSRLFPQLYEPLHPGILWELYLHCLSGEQLLLLWMYVAGYKVFASAVQDSVSQGFRRETAEYNRVNLLLFLYMQVYRSQSRESWAGRRLLSLLSLLQLAFNTLANLQTSSWSVCKWTFLLLRFVSFPYKCNLVSSLCQVPVQTIIRYIQFFAFENHFTFKSPGSCHKLLSFTSVILTSYISSAILAQKPFGSLMDSFHIFSYSSRLFNNAFFWNFQALCKFLLGELAIILPWNFLFNINMNIIFAFLKNRHNRQILNIVNEVWLYYVIFSKIFTKIKLKLLMG